MSGTIAVALANGFSGLGWWLWRSFVPTHPVAAPVFGFIVVATGALGLCLAVRNLIRPVAFAIQISDKGTPTYRGRSPDLIQWADIKRAHAAVETTNRVGVPIIALELVDPRSFYARLDAEKPRWLGPDTGFRPTYYALASTGLDMEPEQIQRWYRGQLTGQSAAYGPQGRYEGNWTDGVPEGTGVFVTRDGRRFEGKWREGKPVDPEVARLMDEARRDCLWDIASRPSGDRFTGVGAARCRSQ